MNKITFETDIHASAKKVWQVLWSDSTYRQWTSAFMEGSYAVTDWTEGSKVHFLSPGGNGMYSIIEKCMPRKYMAIKHLGSIKEFKEVEDQNEINSWSGAMEIYTLEEVGDSTHLKVEVDAVEEFAAYFKKAFPLALQKVKEISEKVISITITKEISTPVAKAWQLWNNPEDIMQWNSASDDWHTTKAENDLRIGGTFLYHMAAKDGSFGFDLKGTYTHVEINKLIQFELEDGRKIQTVFIENGTQTEITETFDAEEENTIELQKRGWQNILDNFKKYAEWK